MYNLEQSIVEWRKQMLAAGIISPVLLEELENHLREEIQQQIKFGLNEHDAFELSVQRIGPPGGLKHEFQKNERSFMKQTAKISARVIGLLIGMECLVPGSIQLRHELIMTGGKFGLWLLGWGLLTWSFVSFQRIVRSKMVKEELEKVEMTFAKQTMKMGAGVAVVLTGLVLMLPAVGQDWHESLVKFNELCGLVFGFALLIAGALVTFCPYKRGKA